MKFSILLLMLTFISQDRTPLHEWLWKNRLIIIENDGSDNAQTALNDFQESKADLDERHMILVELSADEVLIDGKKTEHKVSEIRNYLEIEKGVFEMILIGKDGGIKLRSNSLLPAKTLYSLVDSMPMRQAEMDKN